MTFNWECKHVLTTDCIDNVRGAISQVRGNWADDPRPILDAAADCLLHARSAHMKMVANLLAKAS